jgi:hypothetical protein
MSSDPEAQILAAAVGRPGYRVSHFSLEIGGQTAGYLSSVEGGGAHADVVVESPIAGQPFQNKHLGGVIYEDVTITVDLSLDPVFYTWISDTLAGKSHRRDGAVVTLDADLKVRRQMEFYNALITEINFPKLDGSPKEAGLITVKISPEYSRTKKGSGLKSTAAISQAKKKWLTSNFRLEIDGLDCRKIQKIDSFTIKQGVITDTIGVARDYEREPAQIEYPNLFITLAESAAQTFIDWHDDFLIKGNNGANQEKSGTLTFLSADLKTTLGEVRLGNLGIFSLSTGKRETSSDQVLQVIAGLYVEQMSFVLGGKP